MNNEFALVNQQINDINTANWQTQYLDYHGKVKNKSKWGCCCCCKSKETPDSIVTKAAVISNMLLTLHGYIKNEHPTHGPIYDTEEGERLKKLATRVSLSFEFYKRAYDLESLDSAACVNFNVIANTPCINLGKKAHLTLIINESPRHYDARTINELLSPINGKPLEESPSNLSAFLQRKTPDHTYQNSSDEEKEDTTARPNAVIYSPRQPLNHDFQHEPAFYGSNMDEPDDGSIHAQSFGGADAAEALAQLQELSDEITDTIEPSHMHLRSGKVVGVSRGNIREHRSGLSFIRK